MDKYIIIAEVFSLLAAIFLAYSTFSKKKDKMIFLQIIDSVFNALANMFLLSFSGAITNILTAIRNIFDLKNKLNKTVIIIFIILIGALGIAFNNTGVIGLLPVVASIEYTICLYKLKTAQQMRFALVINLILWMTYDCYIKSYPMFIMDIIITIVTIINIVRYKKK